MIVPLPVASAVLVKAAGSPPLHIVWSLPIVPAVMLFTATVALPLNVPGQLASDTAVTVYVPAVAPVIT